ncbi:hypothetical protein DPMN_187895 [Dreissena polymorpha]|uniref:Uncharacterized protein n=1 Tax=Dreissena polymorpha TaxID=45954 RepID=A0A9D4DRX6_DREPO|nr:hypothetical protein DPMN_187895 [Dreissena polymorpha]
MMSSTSSNTDFNTNAQFADAQVQKNPTQSGDTATSTDSLLLVRGRIADKLRPNIGSTQITDRQVRVVDYSKETVDSDLAQQAALAVVRDGFYISLTIILEFAASLAVSAIELNSRVSSIVLSWRGCVIQINGTVGAIELNERVSVIELNERVSVIELNERVSTIELNERVNAIELNERQAPYPLSYGGKQLFITNTSITMTMITNTKCRKYPRSERTLPKAFRCPSKLVPRNVTM